MKTILVAHLSHESKNVIESISDVSALKASISKAFNRQDTSIQFDFANESHETYKFNSEVDLNRVDATINNFISRIDCDLTPAEKVSAVYHFILNAFIYAKSNDSAMVSKNCALLACRMLNKLGIPNLIIVSEVTSGKQIWNMVQINNKWYHLDATWYDIPTEAFNYYLVSNEILGVTRNWDMDRYPIANIVNMTSALLQENLLN